MEKSLFLIRLTRIRNQLISDVLDLLFQIRNIERCFADDNGLAVFCRRVYFLWRAALADYIIPAFFREYSETKACRTVFLEFDEKFEITYPIGVSKI